MRALREGKEETLGKEKLYVPHIQALLGSCLLISVKPQKGTQNSHRKRDNFPCHIPSHDKRYDVITILSF